MPHNDFNDYKIKLLVVGALGTFSIVGLLIYGWAISGRSIPEGHVVGLATMIGTAVGQLGSMLSQALRNQTPPPPPPAEPLPVVNTNTEENPVIVREEKKDGT